MGIFNKVVNILVLVFAVAGVALSFLLFNKREMLVAGWEEMSSSIAQTAKSLEKDSGMKLSAKVNKDALGHKNPDNADLSGVKRALPELTKAAKQINEQRNSLADSLSKTGHMLEVNVSASDLQNVSTSADKQKNLLAGAQKTADRNNVIAQSYVKSANKLINTNMNALKANPGAVAANFDRKIDETKSANNAYANTLAGIGRTVGKNFNRGDVQRSAKEIEKAVANQKNELNKARGDLNRMRNNERNLKGQISNKDNQIRQKNNEIAKLQKDIQRLKWLLDPDSGKLEPVEADLYARIEGRVEKVQDRWAFIVINLGEKMPVIEHFKKGDKTRYLSLAQGFPITVARNLTSDEPEFVAKAVIVQVNDNCAVASIDKDSMQSEIKVGDSVYFTKENIAELLKLKEKMATSTKK